MPSSYTPSLRLTLPVTGENSGTWGDLVNNGITSLVDASVAGYAAVTMTDANYTLTTANGAADESRKMMLNISGTLSAPRNVICPTTSKLYFIKNATTGGFAITLKTAAGSGVSIPNGKSTVLMCDGTNVVDAVDPGVTSVTATSPVASTGGTTPVISMPAATASVNGYMNTTYAARLDNAIAGNQTGNFGYLNIPQNSRSSNYTLVLSDAGKHIYQSSSSARTFEIPSNASVAFPIGTAIMFVNAGGAGDLTIKITSDTMRLAVSGLTGDRTLVANGVATALKIASTLWIIYGEGLS